MANKDFQVLSEIEDNLNDLSDDANNNEIFEMLGKVLGVSTEEIQRRYVKIQSSKN